MSQPQVLSTIAEVRAALGPLRRAGKRIGLVPTMGALHAGHLSLVKASKAECDATVVTIFVNPAQFGPQEDLGRYPRTLAADLALLAGCQTDFVFVPSVDEVYGKAHATWVEVEGVARPLEGERRPGHFRGVATVVLKLFNMCPADIAYFGQKDYQQVMVIRRMVADLNVPIELCVCPIVREADGLAMSSRNAYLSPVHRQQATVLWKSLAAAQRLVAEGSSSVAEVSAAVQAVLATAADAQMDYVALVDPETLMPLETLSHPTLLALAVRIGNTRLIDNCLLP